MTSENFNPSKSFKLIEMDNHLNHLIKLYKFKKFPKVILMSGKKGSGKFTLVNHFLNYIFSEDTYDLQRKTIDQKSKVYNDQINNVFTNIIHLKNDEGVTTKIDDIRILKSVISKSVFNNKPRYIIIDDAELLNINSSNALLKIIEEPTKDNHFIIIDNQQKDIVNTISSRCFKMNIFLKKTEEIQIIKHLIKRFKIENELDYIKLDLTPGLFLKYNFLCFENNITNEMNYLNKIEKLLLLFKKRFCQK